MTGSVKVPQFGKTLDYICQATQYTFDSLTTLNVIWHFRWAQIESILHPFY